MITGEPLPVEKKAGDRVTGERSMVPAVLLCGPSGSATTLCSARSYRWWPKPSAAAHRYKVWPIRLPVFSCRQCWLFRWSRSSSGCGWGRSRAGARHCQCGRGTDHRLPVRARSGHPHVHHGGCRRGRRKACWSRMPRRWSGWRNRHPGGGQNRHADRGKPTLVDVLPAAGFEAQRTPAAWPPPGTKQRTSFGGGDRGWRAKEKDTDLADGKRLRLGDRRGVAGSIAGRSVMIGNRIFCCDEGISGLETLESTAEQLQERRKDRRVRRHRWQAGRNPGRGRSDQNIHRRSRQRAPRRRV